jgi:hypothetical protein
MIAVPNTILDPNGGFSGRTIEIGQQPSSQMRDMHIVKIFTGDFYDKKSLALRKCRAEVMAVSDSDHEGKDRGDIHPAWQDDDVDYVDWVST